MGERSADLHHQGLDVGKTDEAAKGSDARVTRWPVIAVCGELAERRIVGLHSVGWMQSEWGGVHGMGSVAGCGGPELLRRSICLGSIAKNV